MSFVDDFSGLVMVYFLKQKSDAVAAAEKFLADVAPHGRVARLRTDNGTEYTCGKFTDLLIQNKIKHETSSPYSPHQNGTAERFWRSLFDMARCLLLEATLPKSLWTYAVMASAYIRNRCYNSRIGMTPYEAMTGLKPNLSGMHIFGSTCYAYVQQKAKLDARYEKGIFVGYDKGSPAYLVYFPEKNNIKRVRCVKFTDNFEKEETLGPLLEEVEPRLETLEAGTVQSLGVQPPTVRQGDVEENDENGTPESRYPKRVRNRPKYLDEYETENSIKSTVEYCYAAVSVPQCYADALSSPEAEKWADAMHEEMSALRDNETFELVPHSESQNVVGENGCTL